MSKIDELKEKINQIKEQMKEEASKAIQEEYIHLFESYPKLVSFNICGWIPSFNDGDPCTFSCNNDSEFSITWKEWSDVFAELCCCDDYEDKEDYEEDRIQAGHDIDVTYSECYIYDSIKEKYLDSEDGRALLDIQNFRESLDEECLNLIYGDDFELIFTKDGIRVEYYDCGY